MKKMYRLLVTVMIVLISIAGCSYDKEKYTLSKVNEKFTKGAYGEAVQEGETYLKENPDSDSILDAVGWAYLRLNKLNKAEECFDNAIKINKENDQPYLGKSIMYNEQGNLKKARECVAKAIEINPNEVIAYASLISIELKENNFEKVVEYGEKAWKINREYADIPAYLSVGYHYLGDYKKRDEFYEHAKKLNFQDLQWLKQIYNGEVVIN